MNEFIRSFVSTIQRANNVLIATHEYLPLSLALALPALVKTLTAQQKQVTVLIAQEPYGWSQRIDSVYPIDMVLTLDEVKQVISIPVSSEDFGAVSYEVVDNSLNISIVPGNANVAFDKLQTMMFGSTYDVVIGLGLTAKHSLVDVMAKSPASLGAAQFFFIGSISPTSSLQQAIPYAPAITTLDATDGELLAQLLHETQSTAQTKESRELVTALLYALARYKYNNLSEQSWGILQSQVKDGIETDNIAKLFTVKTETLNARVNTLMRSCVVSQDQSTAIFTVRQNDLSALNATAADMLYASYSLPEYPGIQNAIVLVEVAPYEHHVQVFGTGEGVRRVAVKYGFPYTNEVTGGRVMEVVFDKLYADIARVVAEEEIVPIQSQPIQAPTQVMQQSHAQPVPHVPQSPSIPTHPVSAQAKQIPVSPSIEQIAQQTSVTIDEPESEQVQPVQVQPSQEQFRPIPVAPQPVPPPASRPSLDFASIARKMKEQTAMTQGVVS